MKKELWVLIHLSMGFAGPDRSMNVDFDRGVWNNIVDKCKECGYDTILLDVCNGIKFKSHPEIADPHGWSPEEVTAEVHRLREMGIKLYPKLNFSAAHDWWLGDYRYNRSTPEYYKICKELIEEICEIFEGPEYFHLGLDEEFPDMENKSLYRKGDALFKDYRFLMDCVKECGAKYMMFSSTCMHNLDLWSKYIPEDMTFTIGQYYEFEESKWTKISDQPLDVQEYYWNGGFEARRLYDEYKAKYGDTRIEYVEQEPTCFMFMDFIERAVKRGHKVFIQSSNFYIDTNDRSAVEYYHGKDYNTNLPGHLALPWVPTNKENEGRILRELENLANAVKEFYGE